MSNLKIYQLKNIKQCKFKGFVSSFKDFKTSIHKSKMIKDTYKYIIKNHWLEIDKLDEIIDNQLDNKYFITKEEKQEEIKLIKYYITRYFNYEKNNNRKILNTDIFGSVSEVEYDDIDIDVSVDIVFENSDSIELVKYTVSKTGLSYKARTINNLPGSDIELYLIQKLGEEIYSKFKKPIIASRYHFVGKNDDKDVFNQYFEDKGVIYDRLDELESKFVSETDKKLKTALNKEIKKIKDTLYYNNSEGNNIITRFKNDRDLTEDIIELTSQELDFNSEKCVSGDCSFCSYSTLCKQTDDNSLKQELKVVESVEKSSGDVKLTDNQKQVVVVEEGNYRINSVAGSGKSTTMVMRTIELIKKGYNPSDILLITFTNKGCQELKDKIVYWLKYYGIKGVNPNELNIYTFNSFGDNIIKKEWSKLGFSKCPDLATLIDVNDIIKDVLEDYPRINWLNYKNPLMNFPNAKGIFTQLRIYFNYIKSYGIDGFKLNFLENIKDGITIDELNNRMNIILDLFNKYNEKLKEKCLLEYSDQVLYLIELLEKEPSLINKYGYSHLIIDEYQDTDKVQVKLIKILKQYDNFKSLMVVGDNSQSVYGFRNTTPENIIKFHEEFEDVKDIGLLDNFRSTPEICYLANQLDKLNEQRIDKEMMGRKPCGKEPVLLKYDKQVDEYNDAVRIIEDKINEGVPMYEISFISRTKKELLELQKYLNAKNIPSIIEVSELYIDNPNVKVILNLVKFFGNHEETYYLLEYLYATEDISNKSQKFIQNRVNELKEQLIAGFNLEHDDSESEQQYKLQYIKELLNPIIEKDEIAKKFVDMLYERKYHTFNEFLSYLNKIVLYQDNTTIDKEEIKYDAVVLTTGHSSKGKEWNVVINAIDKYKYDENVEEERRLLFVSLTRAKEELYIAYSTNQDKVRDKGKYTKFADEINKILVEKK